MTSVTPPSAVTLVPGQPHIFTPQAVTGRSLAAFSNDNTAAGGLNTAPASTQVHLTWEATQDGVTWYEIASCKAGGGGSSLGVVNDGTSLVVSTQPGEIQVRLTAVQPSAVAGSVVLSPTLSASPVAAAVSA